MKRVSVCIATCEGAEFIHKQITSILNQLGDDDEIVLVDDASLDETIKIARSFEDYRMRIYVNNNRLGSVKNFEKSILLAKGKYIFLADQDDEWLPRKIDICLEQLLESDLVIHDCIVRERISTNLYGLTISESYFIQSCFNGSMISIICRNRYLGCCMAFRAELIKLFIPIPNIPHGHDAWIALCAKLFGKVKVINNKLIYYSRHKKNISAYADKNIFTKFQLNRLHNKFIFAYFSIQKIIHRHFNNKKIY